MGVGGGGGGMIMDLGGRRGHLLGGEVGGGSQRISDGCPAKPSF